MQWSGYLFFKYRIPEFRQFLERDIIVFLRQVGAVLTEEIERRCFPPLHIEEVGIDIRPRARFQGSFQVPKIGVIADQIDVCTDRKILGDLFMMFIGKKPAGIWRQRISKRSCFRLL